jgi:hypothetical protein
MFYKIFENMIEVNPILINIQDKQNVLLDVHKSVLKIVGREELERITKEA